MLAYYIISFAGDKPCGDKTALMPQSRKNDSAHSPEAAALAAWGLKNQPVTMG